MEPAQIPDDGRTYRITIALDVTVTDSLAFRAALVEVTYDKEGSIQMTNQNDLPLAAHMVVNTVMREGQWTVPGVEVKLHSSGGTSVRDDLPRSDCYVSGHL